jgi:hypothetical protein
VLITYADYISVHADLSLDFSQEYLSVRICQATGEYVMFFEGAEYMHAQ